MKSLLRGCIAVITCLIFTIQSHAYEIPDVYVSNERKLYRHLLEGYEKTVRPVRNESETLQLSIDLEIVAIEDLEEANQAFYATAWLRMNWADFQLSWDPNEFGGVTTVRIPASDIWIPDIVITNSLSSDLGVPAQHTLAVISHDGTVMWIPPINLRTSCNVDLSLFPFDEHRCTVKMLSWTYHEQLVNISQWELDADKDVLMTGEWLMTSQGVVRRAMSYPCCLERYVDLTFNFNMKRSSTFATHLFLAPSITLSLIIPAVFILPPTSSQKMTMGGAVLLAHVLLLGEFIKYVPSEHPNVPLIARFFLANIVLVSISLAISAVVVNMWERAQTRLNGPPALLRVVFLGDIFTRLMCVNFNDYDEMTTADPTRVDTEHPGSLEVMSDLATSGRSLDDRARIVVSRPNSSARSEWIRLAIVFDRLFFILYLLVVIVISLGYIGYL